MPKAERNLPEAPKQRQKHIPIETLIDLAETKKLSHAQIAKITGCSAANVTQRLQRAGVTTLGNYKQNRADILAVAGKQILASITDEDIKKATLNQKVVSYGILYDKERLERDLSTANTVSVVADIEAVRRAKVEGKRQVDVETVQDQP